REPVRLLDRLRPREGGDDPALRRAQQPLGLVDGLVPAGGLEPAPPHAPQRVDDAVARAQVAEREPALVAEPAAVDVGVVSREDPLDLPLARRGVDVAADGAEAAHRRDGLYLPRPCLEAIRRREERADRAELGDVPGEAAA